MTLSSDQIARRKKIRTLPSSLVKMSGNQRGKAKRKWGRWGGAIQRSLPDRTAAPLCDFYSFLFYTLALLSDRPFPYFHSFWAYISSGHDFSFASTFVYLQVFFFICLFVNTFDMPKFPMYKNLVTLWLLLPHPPIVSSYGPLGDLSFTSLHIWQAAAVQDPFSGLYGLCILIRKLHIYTHLHQILSPCIHASSVVCPGPCIFHANLAYCTS